MKKNLKTPKIVFVAALLLAGFMHLRGLAQSTLQSQLDPAVISQGASTNIGTYYAYAKMTNSFGTYWITPPTNTLTGTFKDASGFPAPYSSSVVVVRRIDGYQWHTNNNNGITFPATNSSYSLTVYVNSTPPPPTNGQPVTLQVTWQ